MDEKTKKQIETGSGWIKTPLRLGTYRWPPYRGDIGTLPWIQVDADGSRTLTVYRAIYGPISPKYEEWIAEICEMVGIDWSSIPNGGHASVSLAPAPQERLGSEEKNLPDKIWIYDPDNIYDHSVEVGGIALLVHSQELDLILAFSKDTTGNYTLGFELYDNLIEFPNADWYIAKLSEDGDEYITSTGKSWDVDDILFLFDKYAPVDIYDKKLNEAYAEYILDQYYQGGYGYEWELFADRDKAVVAENERREIVEEEGTSELDWVTEEAGDFHEAPNGDYLVVWPSGG